VSASKLHQQSIAVHTAIGTSHTSFAYCLLAGSGWNSVPSWSR